MSLLFTITSILFMMSADQAPTKAVPSELFLGDDLGELYDIRTLLDHDDHLFVISVKNRIVGKINLQSKSVQVLTSHGDGPGEMEGPSGLCIVDDVLYVADGRSRSIEMYDFDGNYQGQFRKDVEVDDLAATSSGILTTRSVKPIDTERHLVALHYFDASKPPRTYLPIPDHLFGKTVKPEAFLGFAHLSLFNTIRAYDGQFYLGISYFISSFYKADLKTGKAETLPIYHADPTSLVWDLDELRALNPQVATDKSFYSMSSLDVDDQGNVHILGGVSYVKGQQVLGHSIAVVDQTGKLLKRFKLDRDFKRFVYIDEHQSYLAIDAENQYLYEIKP